MAAGRIEGNLLPEQHVAIQSKCEQAIHAAAIEFALCRAISYLFLEAFPQFRELRKCGSFLFSVRLVQSSSEMSNGSLLSKKTGVTC